MNGKIFLLSSALLIAAIAPSANATPSAAQRGYADQLGPNARALYRDIFALIKSGQWDAASAKLAAMPEGPLHNVARAELYLAKGSPKVDGETLAALAEKARELPQAVALVRLAKTRGVEILPALPTMQNLNWLGSAPRRSKVAGSEASGTAMAAAVMPLLKNDQPNEAEAVVEKAADGLDSETLTEWQHRVAWSYYLTGDDSAARNLAAKASAGSGDWAAQADWVGGLAAWRQRDYLAASEKFAAAARRSSDSEMVAAGHFWAARADMASGKPEKIDSRLRLAARQAETFYGLLALQRLGLKAKPIDQSILGSVEKRPNVRAALALAEIGELGLADDLIRHQARIGDARDHGALATIAGRMDLPATQLWLAHNGPSGATAAVTARYPNPKGWQPVGGWRVDKALVFAHALQESQFRTNVTSHAGARGLMQVLPGTAAMIARRKGEASVGALNIPSVNLEYGQSFIETVRDMSETGGLLPKVIAAYNAGPQPVGQWNQRTRDNADPLLYIESIPYWETRSYVTIVMRNYWMYQLQAGDQAKSLAALSQGMWPRFPGLPGATAVRLNASGGTQSAD
ncbi:MAG: lytic transglycosylase domain-containing protein [Pseudomonadota bacterium]